MRVKTKLFLGFSFLFAVITGLALLGIIYINKLSGESKVILEANYESLQYVNAMELVLDVITLRDPAVLDTFEKNLQLQENNVTEAGEEEATLAVRNAFEALKNSNSPVVGVPLIRSGLFRIRELNMNAIVRKTNAAQATANQARMYLSIIGTLCFLISFSFIINFPRYIANPIRDLTEGIQEISRKNYSQRLHFSSGDEFGKLAEAFNTMAERLDQYEHSNLARILFEKKRIEILINNMKDPVLGFNEKNIVLFANEEALRILNLSESELVGKYAPDAALKNDLLRSLLTANEGSNPLKIFADRKESYFSKEVYPIHSEGKSIGRVILLRNITRFQELDLAKTNFIATISHELKTPISSILMSLQLLENEKTGALSDSQKQLMESLKDDASRLLKITGELLNLSQVESGNIQLSIQQSSPEVVLQYALEAVKTRAEQKHVVVKTTLEEKLPGVKADEEKTAWVLVNLLTNAIDYSPENADVIVSVSRVLLDELRPAIRFSVRDFGKGIDMQYTGKIFDRYFRVPGSKKEGSGLGLAICKEFIEAQNGRITVKSEPGAGCEFSITLPAIE